MSAELVGHMTRPIPERPVTNHRAPRRSQRDPGPDVCSSLGRDGLEVQALVRPCNQALFSETSQLCLQNFHLAMANTSYQERCPWPAVKG
ncbi:hypothetical protein NHX12_007493 [Muraenolepis orangiensis]|uniref:Uncharacterized protein n=1 Tax=Muraenolepis orangiensis TaxID=630683 RepID=A0A9Q0DRG6_9TELE|nr:hypothetical protein NHX12_007493 [Muraenolepis orangiensis]